MGLLRPLLQWVQNDPVLEAAKRGGAQCLERGAPLSPGRGNGV